MPDMTMREAVARRLFTQDWPHDGWDKHIIKGKPDAAMRRYLDLADAALSTVFDLLLMVTPEMVEAGTRSIAADSIYQGYNAETREAEYHRMRSIWEYQLRNSVKAALRARALSEGITPAGLVMPRAG